MMLFLLLLVTVVTAKKGLRTINVNDLQGMRKLLRNNNEGIITTCKIVFFSELVTFDEADSKCKSFDVGMGMKAGNLVTVNDADKNKDLKLLLELAYPKKKQPKNDFAETRWVWAGLRKTKNNQSLKPGKYNALDWNWADGSNPKDFSKWYNRKQPDQRSLTTGKEGCKETPRCFQNQMRINHKGLWDDTFKHKKHPYACDYTGKYVLSSIRRTWKGAKLMCEKAGLHLAMIRTADEVTQMKKAMEYFLGAADPKWKKWSKNNWIWTGGNDLTKEDDWRWLDDSPVDTKAAWFKWIRRAGNDNNRKGQHALSFSRKGEFDDSFHASKSRARGFACQCKNT